MESRPVTHAGSAQPLQITAGTECLACARQYDTHDVRIAGQTDELFRQVADHGSMKRVKSLSTVERDHSNSTSDFQLDLFIHGSIPFRENFCNTLAF